jgi:hypothetical protein
MRPHPLLLAIIAVLPGCDGLFDEVIATTGCMLAEEDDTSCPSPKEVSLDDLSVENQCGPDIEIVELKGQGELRKFPEASVSFCCYPIDVINHDPEPCPVPGRPYLELGKAQQSRVFTNQGSPHEGAPGAPRAHAWALAGAAEHASVAAFNRLSLQLLALGAPVELLGAVQQAALEEVSHTQACFKLAQEFGGSEVTVGAFPFAGAVDPHVDLTELAYAAVREGCLAETLGASVLASVVPSITDDAVKLVLAKLSQEESEHAVLSFRIVAWAIHTGGQPVRDAVVRALNEPWPRLDVSELALRTGVERSVIEHATRDAFRRVLQPAATALLSSC